jgi:hypothetical protein
VLRGDGFAHDLVGEVAARAVPAPIAELLHRGIAEYLEAQSIAPARIAQHYAEAGAWHHLGLAHLRAAADALRDAAATDAAAGAPVDASARPALLGTARAIEALLPPELRESRVEPRVDSGIEARSAVRP